MIELKKIKFPLKHISAWPSLSTNGERINKLKKQSNH